MEKAQHAAFRAPAIITVIYGHGKLSCDALVKEALGLAEGEEITGFIYLGTPTGNAPEIPTLVVEDFVRSW